MELDELREKIEANQRRVMSGALVYGRGGALEDSEALRLIERVEELQRENERLREVATAAEVCMSNGQIVEEYVDEVRAKARLESALAAIH